MALRLLILKHVRNWSYDTLEREVRANLVYRAFTRIGDEKVPDAKTLARLGQVIGPEVIGELHERLMELARERGVVQGRKMRVDTTVVETNIHYPTDSSLLGDGARVLTRTMKKVEKAAGGLKKRIRNRMRSVNKKVIAIALAGRWKGPEGEEGRVERYRELVRVRRYATPDRPWRYRGQHHPDRPLPVIATSLRFYPPRLGDANRSSERNRNVQAESGGL